MFFVSLVLQFTQPESKSVDNWAITADQPGQCTVLCYFISSTLILAGLAVKV